MGSNGDLISRSALKEKIHDFVYGYRTPKISKGDLEHGLNMFFVDKAPAVDAVEVVRCKDCKYQDNAPCPMRLSFNWTEDNDFCSYGERRANDGK